MRTAVLIFSLILVSVGSNAALADEECAAWCGDGKVWDDNRGECVIAVPPKTS